jgi:SAM-dependent methyltransferase
MPIPSETQALNYLNEFDPPPTGYARRCLKRFVTTLGMVPAGQGRLLELGCDNYFSLLLQKFTSYEVHTQNLATGTGGFSEVSEFLHKPTGKVVKFDRDHFDLELDRFPYDDNTFDVIVCAEVIEHLLHDPMAMLIEIQRVLKPNGALVLTTPNLISWHAILKAVRGMSPLEFSCFDSKKQPPLLQHAKEYLPTEISEMMEASGFVVERMTTPYFLFPHERFSLADYLLLSAIILWYPLSLRHPKMLRYRGPHIFVLARKNGTVSDRFPKLVYSR